jgi:hypothetical protein
VMLGALAAGCLSSVLAVAAVSGCAAAPSCAGPSSPAEVTVTVDATAWAQAHPDAVTLVACAEGSPCRRVPAALLQHGSVFVANVVGGAPQDAGLTVRLRALGPHAQVLLRKTVSPRPTITSEPGPCGTYDVVTLKLVVSADGAVT